MHKEHAANPEQVMFDHLKTKTTDELILESKNLTIIIHNSERLNNMIHNILINRNTDIKKTNVFVEPYKFMKEIK